MTPQLQSTLIKQARLHLTDNSRFHDYGHAQEVLKFTLILQKEAGGDLDLIIPAALFHDLSNSVHSEIEGNEGAVLAAKILISITDYPQEKIPLVEKIIRTVSNGKPVTIEEMIVDDADGLASFTELSLARGFMLNAQKGLNLELVIKEIESFLANKIAHFTNPDKQHLSLARELAVSIYDRSSKILTSILQNYD